MPPRKKHAAGDKPKEQPDPIPRRNNADSTAFSQSPYHDFRSGASWRIFRIMAEFIEGFEFLADLHSEVSIFGSTRVPETDSHYQAAREMAFKLGRAGFTIVTGGGPGIMEAANRGAKEAGAESVGLNIQLPREQRTNPYVTRSKGFHYFFTRKVMLSASSRAYIFFPGGYGTIDELFELLTLIQTKKSPPVPIILVGKDYWNGFFKWMKDSMLDKHQYIDPEDLNIFTIVETADEAFDIIKSSKERLFIDSQ